MIPKGIVLVRDKGLVMTWVLSLSITPPPIFETSRPRVKGIQIDSSFQHISNFGGYFLKGCEGNLENQNITSIAPSDNNHNVTSRSHASG